MKVLCSITTPGIKAEAVELTDFINDFISQRHEVTFTYPVNPLKNLFYKEAEPISEKVINTRTYTPINYFNHLLFANRLKKRIEGYNAYLGVGVNCFESLPFVKSRKQFVSWFSSLFNEKKKGSLINNLTKQSLIKLEAEIIKSAGKLFTQTSESAELIRNHFGVEAGVLEWPVNTKLYRRRTAIDSDLILSINPDDSLINDLLEAFSKLRMKHNNHELLIISESINQELIKRLVNKLNLKRAVHLINDCSQKTLIKAHHSAGMLVCSNTNPASGLIIGRSMASACPVIAVESSYSTDLIKQDYNGYLVPASNPDALSNAMTELIESNRLRNRFVKNGIVKAASIDSRVTARRLIKCFSTGS